MPVHDAPPPRYGFEAFDCAPALRLEAHERVSDLQLNALGERIARLEAALERLERRLWLAVFGVVSVVLAQAINDIIQMSSAG